MTDTDDYAWMRDPAQPVFRDYLAAERAYYDSHSAHLADLIGRLAAESAGRTPGQAEDSVGWPLSGFIYRTRTPEGRENLQFLRSQSGESREQLLLDDNIIGSATGYVEVGVREPSPDTNLLAWSADTSGAEIYQLRIRDLRTGADLPDLVERSYPGVAWSAACDYLFYLVPDGLNRPFQVWRHRVGANAASPAADSSAAESGPRASQHRGQDGRPGVGRDGDVLVYEEADARFEITLRGSRSGGFAVITSASRDTTEVRLVPLADPLADPVLVTTRRRGVEYRIDHGRPVIAETGPAAKWSGPDGPDEAGARASGTGRAGDASGAAGWLYVVTDDHEPEFTLIRAPAEAPGRENWVPVDCPAIAPARADTRLYSCDVLAGHLLLTLRRGGAPLLAITDLRGGHVMEVAPTVAAGTIRVDHAEDYRAGSVIIVEESLIEPPTWYRLDLATGERSPLKRREVPRYQPGQYRTERALATAADGTPIPVTLAYHRQTALDGTAPCLLYGYGAYEACSDPEFSVGLPSLLDRGVVYAIAHVRGGGEGGRTWWQQGRLRNKPTTFTDFIDVADWLAGRDGPARVDGRRIACRGLSAGGLLQGAVYSMRPDRWCAVVAEVPFVDCVTTMLDPSIPLTINEWDEWGDPRDPGDHACLRSYSPYDNPPVGRRPALLVTGAVHDPKVAVHEPAKWVARLRATDQADDDGQAGSPILFRVELGAGAHTGPSGRFARLRYEAEVHAFVLTAMGISR
jgi:oligopeptidase B